MLQLWWHGVELNCYVIADVDNGWGKCIVPIGSYIYVWNVHFDLRLIYIFLNYLRWEALRVVPWLRPSTRLRLAQGLLSRHQPCVPLISTMHGQPFFIPLIDRWLVPPCPPHSRYWLGKMRVPSTRQAVGYLAISVPIWHDSNNFGP